MANDETDTTCSICFESRENLRMLPCWHVACLTCILNMAQTGQGRAMKCHQCREPFLFENVRSLPQPLKCSTCREFLRNPKQLQCCSVLLCHDCFAKISDDQRETVTCPNQCTNSRHQPVEIFTPRICCQCFALHSNTLTSCGHSLCNNCSVALSQIHRTCPLCTAIGSPMPIPIDPVGQYGVSGVSGLDNVLPDGGQPISQMHLMAAMHTVRIWNERQGQQPVQETRYTKDQFKQDFPKGCAVLIAMIIVASGWGFTSWLWMVMALYFVILRPNVTFMTTFLSIMASVFMLYILYQHFFMGVLYIVLSALSLPGIKHLKAICKGSILISALAFFIMLFKVLLAWAFFPSIFIDHAIFDLLVFSSSFLVGLANGLTNRP